MEPWGTPALTGYSFEDFPLEPLKAVYYWQNYKAKIKKEEGQISHLKSYKT